MTIRVLTEDDFETFRSIRLRALSTDPHAFGSTYEIAATYDEATWRSRLAGFQDRPGQVFTDDVDGDPVGVVGVGRSEHGSDATLWGMWVEPEARGIGVGRRLVGAAMEWARARDLMTVTLWVTRSNEGARLLYERCGFELLADVGDNAPDGCSNELRMQRPVA